MAIRRLVNQHAVLIQNGDVQGLRNNRITLVGQPQPNDSQVFVERATMNKVNSIAGGTASFRGRSVGVRQVNDEPLTAGQSVYLSRTLSGEYVVHGSAKG